MGGLGKEGAVLAYSWYLLNGDRTVNVTILCRKVLCEAVYVAEKNVALVNGQQKPIMT